MQICILRELWKYSHTHSKFLIRIIIRPQRVLKLTYQSVCSMQLIVSRISIFSKQQTDWSVCVTLGNDAIEIAMSAVKINLVHRSACYMRLIR